MVVIAQNIDKSSFFIKKAALSLKKLQFKTITIFVMHAHKPFICWSTTLILQS